MAMAVIERIPALRVWLGEARAAGRRIGLVPTMGYLHEGHLSLVRAARGDCDIVVVSVFVNPTQFGPNEDFDRYPRDFERDRRLCAEAGVDAIFHPLVDEMYPSGPPFTTVSVSRLSAGLCGRSRPTHFAGVATVVAKLLNIVAPDRAYFGEKDYQQLAVIRTMVRDLDIPVEIVGCPTVREPDGLAMSSRNTLLTPEARAQAPILHRALLRGRDMVASGEADPCAVTEAVREMIQSADLAEIDYIEVVGTDDLQPPARLDGRVLVAVAVRFGGVRLIDNTVVGNGSA